jgi:Holliday junction DNA helicase RuvA
MYNFYGMIASIEGEIVDKNEKEVILKSGPISWKVFVSKETLKQIPNIGNTAKLWTSLYLRQDAPPELYGFLTQEEREFFELLNSVAGVGPKSALGILGLASVEKIKSAIASGEAELLTKVSGIGRKTAERIIVELRSKIKTTKYSKDALSADTEALDTLVKLGYSKEEARDALQKIPPEIISLEDRLKEALKLLGGK